MKKTKKNVKKPIPSNKKLYEKIKAKVYKRIPKHSAYRSGLVVQEYKKAFKKKYGNKQPYKGKKTSKRGLKRWFKEKWVNQRGKIGYKYKNDIYRPSKRITKKTPITHSELSKKQIKRARKEKYTRGRVRRFKKGGNKTKKINCKRPRGFTQKQHCNYGRIIKKAKAIFKKKNKVSGYVIFEQVKKGVKVKYDIKGLKNGKHGFHVHENGNFKGDCLKAGPHFNPYKQNHSGRKSKKRHIGDLGNLLTKNGKTKGSFIDKKISLLGKNKIIGRSLIVHDLKDDLGKGGDEESLKTGNAGARLNCSKIIEF
jgi:Cu-Zn family superoxide dismutase